MIKKKSYFADILVIIICVFGFFLCLFLFQRDLNATFLRQGKQPVGTITFRYNMAQRRFEDRLIWDRLRNDSPLYNGDIIRTADLSEATITFLNEDKINLSSNTLIQIFYDEDTGSKIEISGGGINVNAVSSGMVIASGNNLVTVESGSVMRLASHTNNSMNISVSEGTTVFQGEAVTAGSGLFLNEAREIIPVAQTVPVSPQGGAQVLTQSEDGVSVDFIWNKINFTPDTLSRLEIARDRSFRQIYFSRNLNEDRLGVVIPPGTWYWRLYPTALSATLSATDTPTTARLTARQPAQEIPYSRIVVAYTHVPVLVSPRENQEITYQSSASVRFLWTVSPQAVSYNLQAADNPSMQNPVLNVSVNSRADGDQLSILSTSLKEGTWFWRITPVYSRDFQGEATPSVVQSFVLKHEPPAPQVIPAVAVTEGATTAITTVEAAASVAPLSVLSALQNEVASRISQRRETRARRRETAARDIFSSANVAAVPPSPAPVEPPPVVAPLVAPPPVVTPPVVTPVTPPPAPVVEPEVVPQPVVEEPVVAQPVIEPVIEPEIVTAPAVEPVAEQSVAEQHIVAQPTVEQPVVVQPPAAQNWISAGFHTITPEQVRFSRDASFSWDVVPEADGYVLKIHKINDNERITVLETPVLSETSFVVEDIRFLGRGDFIWQVEAVIVSQDGSIERLGETIENILIINLPQPRHIRTMHLGTLYGQ
ncbi:MAG: hypothetical protein LBU66_04250 [Treponema sp.]|nr:hypothetical protein [Treponema sp.]